MGTVVCTITRFGMRHCTTATAKATEWWPSMPSVLTAAMVKIAEAVLARRTALAKPKAPMTMMVNAARTVLMLLPMLMGPAELYACTALPAVLMWPTAFPTTVAFPRREK